MANFRLLRKLLEAADSDEMSKSWQKGAATLSLGKLPQLCRKLLSLINSGFQNPIRPVSRLTYGAMDSYDMPWELSPKFRVVDVHRCCLVNPTPGIRFVALSYVWGKLTRPHLVNTKANCSSLYLPKAISPRSKTVPRTVGDAMLVTASLGYKYLWVDAL